MHLILLLSSSSYQTGLHLHYPWHSDFILHYTGVYWAALYSYTLLFGRTFGAMSFVWG